MKCVIWKNKDLVEPYQGYEMGILTEDLYKVFSYREMEEFVADVPYVNEVLEEGDIERMTPEMRGKFDSWVDEADVKVDEAGYVYVRMAGKRNFSQDWVEKGVTFADYVDMWHQAFEQ